MYAGNGRSIQIDHFATDARKSLAEFCSILIELIKELADREAERGHESGAPIRLAC